MLSSRPKPLLTPCPVCDHLERRYSAQQADNLRDQPFYAEILGSWRPLTGYAIDNARLVDLAANWASTTRDAVHARMQPLARQLEIVILERYGLKLYRAAVQLGYKIARPIRSERDE